MAFRSSAALVALSARTLARKYTNVSTINFEKTDEIEQSRDGPLPGVSTALQLLLKVQL